MQRGLRGLATGTSAGGQNAHHRVCALPATSPVPPGLLAGGRRSRRAGHCLGWVKTAAKRAEELGAIAPGKRIGTHTFRHSYARHLLLSDIPSTTYRAGWGTARYRRRSSSWRFHRIHRGAWRCHREETEIGVIMLSLSLCRAPPVPA